MSILLLGDVSEEHRELAKELADFEKQIESGKFPLEKKAQMYVCLAHDWYQIGLEEEGSRFLKKADATYPRYFENVMMAQAEQDPAFAKLVKV